MSWSKNGVRVTSETDFTALRTQWQGEAAANDEGSADAIKTGHAAQIDLAVAALTGFTVAFPDQPLKANAYGSAGSDGSGSMGVSYTPTE